MAATTISRPRFEMRGIRKAFGATRAVESVDLSVQPGEVCALVGQNGAGKSTLMSILSGALQPDEGSMSLDGESYRPRNPLEARRAGVAMIYQELSLAPHLSVTENVVLGMEPSRAGLVRWPDMRETARRALAALGHGDMDLEAPAGALAPAQQQIVELARALAVGCRVLVLDEPTSSLGREDSRRLFEVIAQLKRKGHGIVYISHFIEEVKEVADRIVVLRDGRVAGSLGPAAPAGDIVGMMVGRSVEELYPRTPRRRGEPILELDEFADAAASLTLCRGEIVGIAGLLGAGRTSLMRAVFGLEPVTSGRITIGGWTGRPAPREQWARGMGMLSEDRKGEGLATGLTLADNMTLSKLGGFGPGPLVLPSRQDAASRAWIERLGIRCTSARQLVAQLSGGNQQKVAVARLLHHGVDVFLMDEPTRGIDVASKTQLYTLLDAVVSEANTAPSAVLLVSSYLPELLGLCDRIAVMRRGRLGPARPAAEFDEHKLMMEATGAEDAR